MALFRRFFYRKPPDGLLEISERVFVFDCCFTTDVLEDDEYKAYMGRIVESLREYSPDSSFMVFNFREGDNQSQIAHMLSEYDMTVMDYPRQYENCPLLRMETIHHFLRSSESWLSLGQQNTLLMHCERGGWPVLAFMLAALLIYRKQYTGEQKTLDMIYKQAPRELLQLISPLNPLPSQLRYLQYVSRRNVASEWPPLDRALTLDCVILRFFPNMDGEGGCRPIFRIYGQDPLVASDRAPKVLFSLPKKSRSVRQYKQEDCELVKIDIHCHVQGDVVLECISLDNDLERETMVFRVMFNTAFIRSNILMLNSDEIDSLWSAKNQFPNDFRTEVLFSEMDASSSLFPIDLPGNEEKGLPIEAFAKVQEMFSNVDWLVPKTDEALSMLQEINIHQEKLVSSSPLIAEKINLLQELCSEETTEKPKTEGLQKIDALTEKLEQSPPESAREKSISEKSEDSLKNSQSQALGEEFMAPLKTSLDVKLPAYSKIISQRIPRTSLSTPASYCNSLQGSPMPISRYHSAPSALGITALLHDHKESENKEINHHVRISPSQSFISSQPSLEVPTGLTRNVLLPSLSSTPSSPLVQKSFSAPSTPPPPPPPPIPSSSSVITPTFKKLSSASCPLPTLATTPPLPPPPRLASSSSSATSAPPHPPSPSLGPASSPSIASSPLPPPPPPPPPTPTPGLASSLTIASSMQPPPPLPPPTPGPTSSDDIACSKRPPPLPPPPPPGPSRPRPSTASSAPQPPPPPSLVPNTSLSKNSSLTPPVPPPPVPFSNGLQKTGSTSPHSHSVGSNENIPPVPGPPSIKKGRLPSRVSSRSQDQSRKTPLKPYHWLKLTRAMSGSLWAEAQKADEASKAAEIDISELESLFAATLPTSNNGGIDGKSNNGASGPKSDKVNLVDLRRAYNCEIMLTKVKVPLPELMSSVLALDDTALDIDQVENLIKFCPTKEEIELLKNYNGDREKLGKCEQFFLEMMKVPRVESKLRVFAFKIHFCTQVSDLRNNLNTVNSVAEEIRNSVKLKRTMQTILSLGNALNHGTARGSAVGFRLDSLLKLTDTRARNNKMTLMHYLCKVLAEKLPELLDFPNDLISLEAATKIQLKYLAEEMQAISKGLEKVVQELTVSGNDGVVSENFCKILKEFLGFAEAEVRSLASLYSGVGRNADALALYFGEDPARTPFEQVVSTLLNFVRMFVRAREENCKRLELEKKKAQKEAENENTKNKTTKREVEVQKTNSQKGIRNSENRDG